MIEQEKHVQIIKNKYFALACEELKSQTDELHQRLQPHNFSSVISLHITLIHLFRKNLQTLFHAI